jgi:transposase
LKVDTQQGFSITKLPIKNEYYNIDLNYKECLIDVENLNKEVEELANSSSSGGKGRRKRRSRSRGRSKKYTKQRKTKRGKRERRKSY